MKPFRKALAVAVGAAWAATLVGLPSSACAQAVPGAAVAVSAPLLSVAQLETLVGPIALYPDDLVAIVLPAATTPLDIVKAQRFLDKRKGNASLQPDPNLPEPVRNLLNYPDVVKKMSDDLDWTEGLGQAVVAQQKDVMDAIQAFRRRVYAAGNLKSDPKQVVVVEKEVIKVVQADPQVIYVPQYQPSVVVVAQPAYVYAYYPTPYPVYYYPYPPGMTFATGFFFGAATAYALGWHHHAIHHHYDVRELQEERMDYARESREDWQDHQKEMQSQRSEDRSDRQAQRQQADQPRTQPARTKQQPLAASSRPHGGYANAENWQAQSTPSSAQRPAANRSRPGDYQYAGEAGGAFVGMGSGADANRSSARGSQSRFGGGPATGGGIGGGTRGGPGRR